MMLMSCSMCHLNVITDQFNVGHTFLRANFKMWWINTTQLIQSMFLKKPTLCLQHLCNITELMMCWIPPPHFLMWALHLYCKWLYFNNPKPHNVFSRFLLWFNINVITWRQNEEISIKSVLVFPACFNLILQLDGKKHLYTIYILLF